MSDDRPTFGSLFAGIGGIDLGLERAGWECRFQVEWDEWCQRVLAKHWPDVPRYGDISAVDWGTVERVDLLAGGFPCQPISVAGRKAAQDDGRWLWPEFVRTIRALRPRFVLVENVLHLLAIRDGSVFGEVVGDLAALGYDAEWDCIPASAVGAPHFRDRVWIVADAQRGQLGQFHEPRRGIPQPILGNGREDVADADGPRSAAGLPAPTDRPQGHAEVPDDDRGGRSRRAIFGEGVPQSRMGGSLDGLPGWLDGHRWPAPPGPQFAWEPPRLSVGGTGRPARLKGLGNAVVPQIPEWIGRRLLEAFVNAAAEPATPSLPVPRSRA